jgi:hypothetical protein
VAVTGSDWTNYRFGFFAFFFFVADRAFDFLVGFLATFFLLFLTADFALFFATFLPDVLAALLEVVFREVFFFPRTITNGGSTASPIKPGAAIGIGIIHSARQVASRLADSRGNEPDRTPTHLYAVYFAVVISAKRLLAF